MTTHWARMDSDGSAPRMGRYGDFGICVDLGTLARLTGKASLRGARRCTPLRQERAAGPNSAVILHLRGTHPNLALSPASRGCPAAVSCKSTVSRLLRAATASRDASVERIQQPGTIRCRDAGTESTLQNAGCLVATLTI